MLLVFDHKYPVFNKRNTRFLSTNTQCLRSHTCTMYLSFPLEGMRMWQQEIAWHSLTPFVSHHSSRTVQAFKVSKVWFSHCWLNIPIGWSFPLAADSQWQLAEDSHWPWAEDSHWPWAEDSHWQKILTGWKFPLAIGWRFPLAIGWRFPLATGWRFPLAMGWRFPLAKDSNWLKIPTDLRFPWAGSSFSLAKDCHWLMIFTDWRFPLA